MSKWNGKRCPKCAEEGVDTIISDNAGHCADHAPRSTPSKRVTDGIDEFISLGTCARSHGITRSALAYRIRSKSVTYKDWRYIEDQKSV